MVVSAFPSGASADTPAHTDVMFVFDTTGSMGGALNEAKEEIQEAMTQIGGSLPDVQFGLAEVRDYSEVNNAGEFEYDIGSGFQPWTLDVPIGPNQAAITEGLAKLLASGGGDGPEAYGRGLYETDVNPAVGWRAGARSVIVLVADNVPHDNDLNEGIPEELWAEESPFNTGVDPGPDNTVGTPDDLDWQQGDQSVLGRLVIDGRPLEFVDYFGYPPYLPYWKIWTERTGGKALEAGGGSLAGQITELVIAGASAALPPCPPGQARDSNEHCVTPSPPPPPPPPSNLFKFEPRISCARGCHVVLVKIYFDSAGNVIGESIPEEEGKASSVALTSQAGGAASVRHGKKCAHKKGKKCKTPAQISRLNQAVVAGTNTLKLKLTAAALKTLHRKHRLKLRVRFTFTPAGGTPSSSNHTYLVKLPRRKKHHSH